MNHMLEKAEVSMKELLAGQWMLVVFLRAHMEMGSILLDSARRVMLVSQLQKTWGHGNQAMLHGTGDGSSLQASWGVTQPESYLWSPLPVLS